MRRRRTGSSRDEVDSADPQLTLAGRMKTRPPTDYRGVGNEPGVLAPEMELEARGLEREGGGGLGA